METLSNRLTALRIYVIIIKHSSMGCNFLRAKNARKRVFRTNKQETSDMAAKKGNRVKVVLACTECKQRNYDTYKNGKTTTDRLEFNKYCRFCKKHTTHKEAK